MSWVKPLVFEEEWQNGIENCSLSLFYAIIRADQILLRKAMKTTTTLATYSFLKWRFARFIEHIRLQAAFYTGSIIS
jgi:hypothetical protein